MSLLGAIVDPMARQDYLFTEPSLDAVLQATQAALVKDVEDALQFEKPK